VAPFIDGMLRGRDWPPLHDWYGGAGLDTEQEWPPADVHNAREAAWARGRGAFPAADGRCIDHSSVSAALAIGAGPRGASILSQGVFGYRSQITN
jgi:hypothetical protein